MQRRRDGAVGVMVLGTPTQTRRLLSTRASKRARCLDLGKLRRKADEGRVAATRRYRRPANQRLLKAFAGLRTPAMNAADLRPSGRVWEHPDQLRFAVFVQHLLSEHDRQHRVAVEKAADDGVSVTRP